MNRGHLIVLVGIVVAGLVIAAAYYLGMMRGVETDEQRFVNMQAELQRLKEGEEKASVAKRVAEQMEEIARDQRMMSDAQRDSAEKQRLLAEEYAREAQRESELAREAEAKANAARQEAEAASQEAQRERAKAEEKELEALRSKNDADTLGYRNLARTLGNASVLARENDNLTLARKLALTSWYFQEKYGDDKYQAEVFRALVSDDVVETMSPSHSAVYDIDVSSDDNSFVICTGYGEIMSWKDRKLSMIFSDKKYDWRGMVQTSDGVWALNFNGSLCYVSYSGRIVEYALPGTEYFMLKKRPDGKLMACARHRVVMFDVQKRVPLVVREELQKRFSVMAITHQEVLYFFSDGSVGITELATGRYKALSSLGGDVVTAAQYDRRTDMLYIGLASGKIQVMKKGGVLYKQLTGHKAAIMGMTLVVKENLLLSIGRDKELHIWNLDRLEQVNNVVSTSYRFDVWPMCIEAVGSKMLCGMSTGKITQWELSIKQLAKATRDRLKEGLSESEWNHYVGTRVKYMKLK